LRRLSMQPFEKDQRRPVAQSGSVVRPISKFVWRAVGAARTLAHFHIGVMKALHRDVVPEFNPIAKRPIGASEG
jgi:hypothetical protein